MRGAWISFLLSLAVFVQSLAAGDPKGTLEPSTKTTAEPKNSTTSLVTSTATTPLDCSITVDGDICTFNFIYKDKTYNGCIKEDNGDAPWCPTSLYSTTAAKDFGNCNAGCSDTPAVKPERCQTLNGFNCAKNYTYNDVLYENKCTKAGSDKPWCAITTYNETLAAKDYYYCNEKCDVEPEPNPEDCITDLGQKCQFPFQYNGVTHKFCTMDDNGDSPWCALSTYPGGNIAKAWGNCNTTICGIPSKICEDENGYKCVFPFYRNGIKYNECVFERRLNSYFCLSTTGFINICFDWLCYQ